jgi:hypothetical protein
MTNRARSKCARGGDAGDPLSTDPVRFGLAKDRARQGGNVTGMIAGIPCFLTFPEAGLSGCHT